jgi:hypothetical protein
MPPTVRSTPVKLPGRAPEVGAVKLFAVPLASAMSDQDVSSLVLALGFDTRSAAAGSPPEARLVSARLDHDSGLFLEAGEAQGQWVLQARTWGHPDPESVHRCPSADMTIRLRSPMVTSGEPRTHASRACAAASPGSEQAQR